MEPADWDLPEEVWNDLEKRTRPEEEYMTWYNKFNTDRFVKVSEFQSLDSPPL
jgi:hypothetical protein